MKAHSRSNVLNHILSGHAVPCGSGMFQTADGAFFLGAPSKEAVSEAKRLAKQKKTPLAVKNACQEFLAYVKANSGGAQ